jgi:hypothetical protein
MTARKLSGYQISRWAILFVLLVGVGSLAFYLRHAYRIHQVQDWPTVQATVTSCNITAMTNIMQGRLGNRIVHWDELAFAFSYWVSGREYISRRFYLVGNPPVQIVARDFPVGRQFLARYNASSPDTAVVEPGPLYYRVLAIAVLCLGLAGTGMIYNKYQT